MDGWLVGWLAFLSGFATRWMYCYFLYSQKSGGGVILDSNLYFENHISNVTKAAFFHLRNIALLLNMLSVSDAEKLVHAFMTSRLDYCNVLLGGCPASSINKPQIVQHAAARVLIRSRKYDHITPIFQRKPTISDYTELTTFSHKLIILSFYNINLF